jgi:predicted Zn finger-like uncharacterized protein
MDITCPHCGFSGTIQDGIIPESGRAVNCPKCKKKFFASPQIPIMEIDEPIPDMLPSADIDDIPMEKAAPVGGKNKPRKQDTVKTVFVAFGLIFGMFLCFIAGRISLGQNPLSPMGTPPPKPSTAPTKIDKLVVSGMPSEMPIIVVPGDSFKGAETIAAAEVDEEVSEISSLADPERKDKFTAYAAGIVGKNITGVFLVEKIGTVSYFYDALLPKKVGRYFLEGVADTKSAAHVRIFLTMDMDQKEFALFGKTKKVSVAGFVMSSRASDVLELSLANAQVRPGK